MMKVVIDTFEVETSIETRDWSYFCLMPLLVPVMTTVFLTCELARDRRRRLKKGQGMSGL